MIKLEKLTLSFHPNTPSEKKAIDSLDLSIQNGEFVILIGGNGAGKSTLFRLLAGEQQASQGRIYLDDEDVTRQNTVTRAKTIARVFQDPLIGTFEHLTIEENLALALHRGRNRRFGFAIKPNDRQLFRSALAELDMGLENRLDVKAGMLSGGQRQALSLIMATLQPAKLLLLDEHTAALDKKTEALIIRFTEKKIRENKLTALMITHNLHHALTLGDRTLIMQEGKVIKHLDKAQRRQMTLEDLIDSM